MCWLAQNVQRYNLYKNNKTKGREWSYMGAGLLYTIETKLALCIVSYVAPIFLLHCLLGG